MIRSKYVTSKFLKSLPTTPSSILQAVKLVTDSAMLVVFVYEFRKLKTLLHAYMQQGQAANKT